MPRPPYSRTAALSDDTGVKQYYYYYYYYYYYIETSKF
jgi:hypothetical protein